MKVMDLGDDVLMYVHQLKQMCPCGGGVDNGRGSAYVETVNLWATCVPSSQFCCELKMTEK